MLQNVKWNRNCCEGDGFATQAPDEASSSNLIVNERQTAFYDPLQYTTGLLVDNSSFGTILFEIYYKI